MKKLQIHVPVFNEEESLPKFVDSIRAQTFRDAEYIFHDNHSTDRTLELIRQYSKESSNLYYKSYPRNTGPIDQIFRVMYSVPVSEYIGIRSANDLMDETYIEQTMELLESDSSIGLAYSHGRSFNSVEGIWSYLAEAKIDTREKGIFDSAIEVMSKYTEPFSLWGVYRGEIFSKLQPYRYCHGGDHIFICEAAFYGGIASTDEVLDNRIISAVQIGYNGVLKNSLNQMEEFLRGVTSESMFNGLKYLQPFSDMAWGHVEMISMAQVTELEKYQLSEIAISIFKQRFKSHIEYENRVFLNFLEQSLGYIEKTQSIPRSVLYLWKSKAHKEIEKIFLIGDIQPEVLGSFRNRLDLLKGF
jgi:glycosyltransferase involved in cell wall biosynthesis